jgi:hypothetical protein
MDSASSRLRWAGNTLGIEGPLDKARYIGGFQAEGNDLSYMIRLLFLADQSNLLFRRDRRALTLGLTATIGSAAFDRLSKRRSARDQPRNYGAVNSVG